MEGLSKRKKLILVGLAGVIVLSLLVYGIYFHNKANDYKRTLNNQYDRAFYDLVDNINNTETFLLKAVVTGTEEMQTLMLEEAGNSAAQAESCLALLPVDGNHLSKISDFLVQLKDISATWDKTLINGGKLTEEQYKTLEELYGYAQDLNGAVHTLWTDFTEKGNWDDVSVFEDNQHLSEPFQDYPQLIYDGPFSEHMKTTKSVNLKGEKVSQEDAKAYVEDLFEFYTPKVEYTGENETQGIEVYSFNVTFSEKYAYKARADVTKIGGKLCSMIMYRETGEENLTPEQAVMTGESYLNALGYIDMVPSYYTVQDGYVTANYAYMDNGVICFPDMVKVKISMDNGEVVGFEALSYLLNHRDRDIPKGKISMDEAEKSLSPNINCVSKSEAIIPNDFGGEEHVYQFTCNYNGRNVLIYKDVETGAETEVLIILEDENGVLTI